MSSALHGSMMDPGRARPRLSGEDHVLEADARSSRSISSSPLRSRALLLPAFAPWLALLGWMAEFQGPDKMRNEPIRADVV